MPPASSDTRFGIGTHRVGDQLSNIIRQACTLGIDYIDTAPNYENGVAQEVIGQVFGGNGFLQGAHSSPSISTKVGFIPKSLVPELLQRQLISEREAMISHSLSPTYLRWQVSENMRALSPAPIDHLFLHNPETLERMSGPVDALGDVMMALRECEELRQKGQFQSYGIATWKGFWAGLSPNGLARMLNDTVGADNGFSSIQLPVSLVRCDELYEALKFGRGTLTEARELGWKVFASSPLHGGELLKLFSAPALRALFGEKLSSAQTILNCIRSSNTVDVILVSTSNESHLAELSNLQGAPKFSRESLIDLLEGIMAR